MKYNVIFFDADGTILDFEQDERNSIINSFAELYPNEKINLEEVVECFSKINKEIWIELESRIITPQDLKIERFKRLSDEIKFKLDPKNLSARYIYYLAKGGVVYSGVHDVLSELSRIYKLVLISNGWTDIQHKRFINADIEKYFDEIIISDELGVAKPQTKIFEYALKRVDCNSKDEVLMVGDSLTSDINGANTVSIDTCWINWKNTKNRTEFYPTYEIKNIKELFDIL